MIKSKARNKPVESRENKKGIRIPLTHHALKFGVFLCLVGASSCATPKYIEKEVEKIVYRDSIVTRIDTVKIQLPPQKVRDYTGLLDILEMETDYAISRSWVDTTKNSLQGTLETKEKPVPVAVPLKEEIHYRDSIVYVEKPYPVQVEKLVKFVPKFWRVAGILGIVLSILGMFLIYLRIKKNNILGIFNS